MTIVKLTTNSRSQAIRLPKRFHLPGKAVFVKKIGSAVVLIPMGDPWGTLKESLGMFSNDFLEQRNQLIP